MAASTKHGASDARDRISAVRDYHRRTKHLPGRYAPGPGYLDWANQPNPFRRYVGARLVELPLACTDPTPPYNDLVCPGAVSPQPLTAETLGLFLELSLGLSAWKAYEGTRAGRSASTPRAATCIRRRATSLFRLLKACRHTPVSIIMRRSSTHSKGAVTVTGWCQLRVASSFLL